MPANSRLDLIRALKG